MQHSLRFLVVVVLFAALAVPALADKRIEGRWMVNVTIPVGPDTNTRQTLALNFEVGPMGDSLHGRIVVTDDGGRTYGAVYRQVGKKFSITFELPCEGSGDNSCGSVVLKGKVKSGGVRIKGSAIVMWDSENTQNPALFDTSNGSFSGDRVQ
ncbi:MAG TPA: hypothetical protein VKM94_07020 [Blastocatellia bacterium]|nr:hypothetical protein [Blastocatellia bacterium]